jgi:carotenoid cleavage dioxygenase
MVHAIRFEGGRAHYRNRMVRTSGLAAELAAGEPLWAGIIEPATRSQRDGVGARGRMKDASSTDVVVHAGRALTSFYQCGELYAHELATLEAAGPLAWSGGFGGFGVSAHPKLDEVTGELLVFGYGTRAPYFAFGVVDRDGALVHERPVPLPGPRLPHDLAFTEHHVIVGDFPLFWDPELLARGIHRPRWNPQLPTRFGVVPRRGHGEIRWFEAAPTYVLHFINAYEQGDTIVIDGYFQADPMPKPDPADGPWAGLRKMVDVHAMRARPHRWRLDLVTGTVREERLFDVICEFPSIDGRVGGRRHRFAYAMTAKPGWFLFDGMVRFDLETGDVQRFGWPDGVYGSEAPIARRRGATAEADGYAVTFVSDTTRDESECQIFDAHHLDAGPLARVRLPERICAGTHACWAPA